MSSEQKDTYVAKAELYNSSDPEATVKRKAPTRSSKTTSEGKASEGKAAKGKAATETTRKRSAYQVYISESVKAGVKLGDAASTWKTLSEETKAKYEERAGLQVESAPAQ